jgi:hypothetical protein
MLCINIYMDVLMVPPMQLTKVIDLNGKTRSIIIVLVGRVHLAFLLLM